MIRYSEYLDTAAKLLPQQQRAKFYYCLFSESGFDESIVREAKEKEKDNIMLFPLTDIIRNHKMLK